MMKQNFKCYSWALVILLLFITSSCASARSLAANQDEAVVKSKGVSKGESVEKMGDIESLGELMGWEQCENNGDEECSKRRVVAEAHLDYIYTQHHKD